MGVKLGTDNNWAIKDGNLLAYNDASGRFFNKEFDFARGSRATYVGRDGLIKNSGEQPTNLVQNGDFSQLGSELIVNGSFATDSNWTKGTGWTISGTLNAAATTSTAFQINTGIVSGKTYKVIYTISNYVSGSVRIELGSGNVSVGTSRSANGTYTEYIVALGDETIYFDGILAFTGSIDNVSVKQVDPNDEWSLGAGWSIGDGSADSDGTGGTLQQLNILESGKIYKINCDASGVTNTFAFTGFSDSLSQRTIPNGNTTFFLTANSTTLGIFSNGIANISNISVQEIDTNTPRIDFTDDVNGHLLLEPQRTNLITESAVFSGYSGTNAVITDNSITSPDGALTGAILADDNAGGTGVVQVFDNVTVDVSSTYTWSVFAKKKDLDFIALRTSNFTTPINDTSFFDLNLGTVVSAGSGQVAEIENYGNGWYRCSVTFTTDAADTSGTLATRLSQDGTSTASVDLDNTSNIYIWGWQFEKGSYATSYIPTYGSTQTRLGETCNNSGSAQDFNSEEGVVYCEIASLAETPETRMMLGIGVAGSGDNRVTIEYNVGDTNIIRGQVRTSSLQTSIGYTVTSTKDFHKVALVYQLNNIQLWIDGVKRNEDLSADVSSPNTISSADFLNNNTNKFEGKCKGFRLYDTVLTDAELEALTT